MSAAAGPSAAGCRPDVPPAAAPAANGDDGLTSPYSPPAWARRDGVQPPATRAALAHLPTPLHRWRVPGAPPETEVWIKRDDMTGGPELSGNKVRKLEFLIADAVRLGRDCVVTVGALQSNHCRATAAAARHACLEPHVVLRCPEGDVDAVRRDPGLRGNLLIARLVGAKVHLVSHDEYARVGGAGLVYRVARRLEQEGRRPYTFPSGGSNAVGCWGYVEASAELLQQAEGRGLQFDRVYAACGSGGTAAGLALGLEWSGARRRGCELVCLGVDDTPADFYAKLRSLFDGVGERAAVPEDLLRIEQCVGPGYGAATEEGLRFIADTARATGVVLDPVYSGKAAFGMIADLRAAAAAGAAPRRVAFVHTGGLLGMAAKEDQLLPLMPPADCAPLPAGDGGQPAAKRPRSDGDPPAAVFWDIDGTLVDSLRLAIDLTNRTLTQHGFAAFVVSEEKYKESCRFSTPHRLAYTVGRPVDDPVGARLGAAFDEAMLRDAATLPLYPGVRAAVDAVRAAGAIQGLLTNACGAYARCVAAAHGLDDPGIAADRCLGADDVPAPKPSAAGLLQLASRAGVPPRRCVYVGDAVGDARAAAAAGMRSVGCAWGSAHTAAELRDVFGAVACSPDQLPRLILKAGA